MAVTGILVFAEQCFDEMLRHLQQRGYPDIAETDQGMKIIEYNTFDSGGLYACDVAVIIDGVSDWAAKTA